MKDRIRILFLRGLMTLLIMIVVVLVGLLIHSLFTFESEPDYYDACENVGGSYEVIGREFSPALKINVDVYGCVK